MPSNLRLRRENEKQGRLSTGKTVRTDSATIPNRPLEGEKVFCTGNGRQLLGQFPKAASSRGSRSPSFGLNLSDVTSRIYPGSLGRDAAKWAESNAQNISDSQLSFLPESIAAEENSFTRPSRGSTKRVADDKSLTPTKSGRGRAAKKIRGPGRPKKSDQKETSVLSGGSIDNPVSFNEIESVDENPVAYPSFNPESIRSRSNLQPASIDSLQKNPEQWFGDSEIFAFICYICYRSNGRATVLDSLYLDMHAPTPAINSIYPKNDTFEILFLPLHFPGHWTLVIYDRKSSLILFLDSLWLSPSRLEHNPLKISRVKKAISEIVKIDHEGIFFTDVIPELQLDTAFDRQNDSHSCGPYVCLFAESYLNFGHIALLGVDLVLQRQRILRTLQDLLITDDPPYEPITFIQNQPKLREIENDAKINHKSTPRKSMRLKKSAVRYSPSPVKNRRVSVVTDYPVEAASFGDLLRDEYGTAINSDFHDPYVPKTIDEEPITENFNVNFNSKPNFSVEKINKRCKNKHPNIGCAGISAKHASTYHDSGNYGDKICKYKHCSAQLLSYQSSSLCCSKGKVLLEPLKDMPYEYKQLLEGDDRVIKGSKDFVKNQRMYNNLLQFASIHCGQPDKFKKDALKKDLAGGPPALILNGEFLHQISGIYAGDKQRPSFSQLYILDPKEALDNRATNPVYDGKKANIDVLNRLDRIIREHHPLATVLINYHEQYNAKLIADGPDSVRNFTLIMLNEKLAPSSIINPNLHPRVVNLPDAADGLFAIWSADTDITPELKGIWLTGKQGLLRELKPFHMQTDPACYPLLFPNGDTGYHFGIDLQGDNIDIQANSSDDSECEEKRGKQVSVRQYIRHRLAKRKTDGNFHPIWRSGGGLSQKYLLDYAARIDDQVAKYQRELQKDFRATAPESLLKYLEDGLKSGEELGRICLHRKYQPATSPYYQEKIGDSTIISMRFCKPGVLTFFFTFTSNPKWPEIQRHLYNNGQTVQDRPELWVDIYTEKQKFVQDLIVNKGYLGKIRAWTKSMEFQKRGGPHHHYVLWTDVLASPENVDEYICAEIPPLPNNDDKSESAIFIRKLRELVIRHQIHRCNVDKCLNKGKVGNITCCKKFPMAFSNSTILFEDRPPTYRRRSPNDGGECVEIKVGKKVEFIDNSRVVPYNPFILALTESHHNLLAVYGEGVTTKYTLKYPMKGGAQLYVKAQEMRKNVAGNIVDVDEPAAYAKCYYRSAPEAYSRMISIKYVEMSHTVHTMEVHLPDQQTIYYPAGQHAKAAVRYDEGTRRQTELMAFFEACKSDNEAAKLLFVQMPEKYVCKDVIICKITGEILKIGTRGHFANKIHGFSFDETKHMQTKRWVNRKNKFNILGNLRRVDPSKQELYAYRCLLQHIPGPQSPDAFLTVNGHTCTTYVEAATLHGLLRDVREWHQCMTEGAYILNPARLRYLFVSILIHGQATNGLELWNEFNKFMYETRFIPPGPVGDEMRRKSADKALAIIDKLLSGYGKSCKDFNLPQPTIQLLADTNSAVNQFFFPNYLNEDELDETADLDKLEEEYYGRLNAGQKTIIDEVESALKINAENDGPRLFFLTGNAGTGKSFLYNTAICRSRKLKFKVIPTASTGMAATLIFSGTTAHSAFRMGIDIEPGVIPLIARESFFGKRISEADFIIIDEVSMLDKVVIENIDQLCRELSSPAEKPFAGKVVLIGGDWKQSLPVKPNEPLEGQVAACFQNSVLYPLFKQVRLTQNMRLDPEEISYSNWLQKIGTGKLDMVEIPDDLIVSSLQELIDHAYKNGEALKVPREALNGLIIAPVHASVKPINSLIMNTISSKIHTYYSTDASLKENRPLDVNIAESEVDCLNKINPSNFPAHQIELREGCIIVLLTNIGKGLSNGTRLFVRQLKDHLIVCEVLTGTAQATNRGGLVGICRCRSEYKEKNKYNGVHFERLQFPVAPAYALTISKAQGQTLELLGIDLTHEVFGHGQLYTALSRVKRRSALKIYAPNSIRNGKTIVKNIVAKGLDF